MNRVFREEKKFLISVDEFIKKNYMLSQIMTEDAHNGVHGYVIRSLYFDTIYDGDYFEKLAGGELRRKIRLRVYDPSADYAMLEMKQKQGSIQLKRSLKVNREDAISIAKGEYTPLLSYKEPFAIECYALMLCRSYRPKTIVQYIRKAFITKENKIRITFDKNIESTESNLDLFSTTLNMNPVLDKYNVIMEIKYNGWILDYIRRMINNMDRRELSMSKYMLALQNSYQTRI